MNQGDGYRAVQEERYVHGVPPQPLHTALPHAMYCALRMQIDRAIPPLDYGKGCKPHIRVKY